MGKLSPSRLNIGELMLVELVNGDGLHPAEQATFKAALQCVRNLQAAAITAKPADHEPVEYDRMVVGCACGFRPKRASRMSQMMTPYLSHVGKLGLQRPSTVNPRIEWGEHKGKTYREVWG